MFEVIPYSPSEAFLWNSFVEHSRQGTFLFNRGYMDYHSDRFSDCSLMFRRKGRICAVLPANRRGDIL
ncbi:MAG: GNAT family N-acetyltransferase, partial [Prevotella sp.]